MSFTEIYGDVIKNSPEGCVIAHACNCLGTWGAGVARSIGDAFPQSEQVYENVCLMHHPNELLGQCLGCPEERGKFIACLFTSIGAGRTKSSEEQILLSTYASVKELCSMLGRQGIVCSPKINSGLFKVPWALTRTVIEEVLGDFPELHWVVYKPDNA